MVGEMSALACAFLWSLSTVMLKAESGRTDVFSLNALRLIPATVMFLAMLLFSGRVSELASFSVSEIFLLTSSVVIGLGIGDTAFFRSMRLIGVAKALPISNAYPVFTALFAVLFLGEQFTILAGIGMLLIILGVSVIAVEEPRIPEVGEDKDGEGRLGGVILAFVAALAWAASTVILKAGMISADLIAANSIRMPVATVVMLILATVFGNTKITSYGRKSLLNISMAGILGTGVGGLAYLAAVQLAGAAKAAALTSAAPLFAFPLSFLFLREKITIRIIVGTVLTVVGIWLLF